MSDESLPLIVSSETALARFGPQGGSILAGMVNSTLSLAASTLAEDEQRRAFDALDPNVSPEIWFQRGENCYYGRGGSQSHGRAFQCYRTAAGSGHLDALCNVGYMHATGMGVEKAYVRAFHLTHEAMGGEHGLAFLNLGHFFEFGLGTQENLSVAFTFFSMGDRRLNGSERLFRDCQGFPESIARLRTDGYVTSLEMLTPDTFSSLRKVRIDPISFSAPQGKVLVLYGGDSALSCGDVLEAEHFQRRSFYTLDEGGYPAQGVAFGGMPEEIEIREGFQPIVGSLSQGRIKIQGEVRNLARLHGIIGHLYEKGWGVPQNYEQAAYWYTLAAQGCPFKDRIWFLNLSLRCALTAKGRVAQVQEALLTDYLRDAWNELTSPERKVDAQGLVRKYLRNVLAAEGETDSVA
jgi:TPR repeat protein